MEQQQLRVAGCASLSVEDVEAIYVGRSILDRAHGVTLRRA